MYTPLSRRHLLAGAATLALGPRAFAQATLGAQGSGPCSGSGSSIWARKASMS